VRGTDRITGCHRLPGEGEVRPEQRKKQRPRGQTALRGGFACDQASTSRTKEGKKKSARKVESGSVSLSLSFLFFTCQPVGRSDRGHAAGPAAAGSAERKKRAVRRHEGIPNCVHDFLFFDFFTWQPHRGRGRSGWATRLCPVGAKGHAARNSEPRGGCGVMAGRVQGCAAAAKDSRLGFRGGKEKTPNQRR
jgi:hypothetical protein